MRSFAESFRQFHGPVRRRDAEKPGYAIVHVAGEADLVALGEALHPRRDIDGLAEIVEPVVEGDGDRDAAMDPGLEDQLLAEPHRVETRDLVAHRDGRLHRIGRDKRCRLAPRPTSAPIRRPFRPRTAGNYPRF
jgi:hypothetical protein